MAPQLLRFTWTRLARNRCQHRHAIALTYDDGPAAALTPRLLDLLESHGARATFYCMGRQAAANTELLGDIARRGHEIASHSHDHNHAWKSMPWTVAHDVALGFRTLASIHNAESDSGLRFRPTYGKLTVANWFVCRRWGAPIDWWTIDSGDTHDTLPDPKRVLTAIERDGGGVVLLHDFDRVCDTAERRANYVLELTDQICRRGSELGLTFLTMSELMNDPKA